MDLERLDGPVGCEVSPWDEELPCSPRISPKRKRDFQCTYPGCDAAFQKPIRLQWHLKVHSGDRPYKCNVPGCSKAFTRPYHRTRHQQKSHGADLDLPTKFPCPVSGCGKILCTKQLLARHIKRMHDSGGWVCATCKKKFRQKHQLRTHEMEHTDGLPFRCTKEDCGKAFPSNSKLIRHVKSHDGYQCSVEGCGQSFAKWSMLRKHNAVEHRKLHRCTVCGKNFDRKGLLEAHLDTHKDERGSVQCSACSAFLLSKKALKSHAKCCPTGKTKLVCDFPGCEKVYLRKPNFDRHKKLHEMGEKFKLEIININGVE